MRERTTDPVIDEVREVRHQISARFDLDPRRLVAYYLEKQEVEAKKKSATEESDGSSEPTVQAVEARRETV